MMRYVVTTSRVSVIGPIWMPSCTAAMDYTLDGYALENIKAYGEGEITREAVALWLSMNSGDFQYVSDFNADISYEDKDYLFEWESDESFDTYCDCMYGDDGF